MTKPRLLLLFLYLAAAAAYGGWRGAEVWSGWGIWCWLIPPAIYAAVISINAGRRNPTWWSVQMGAAMTAFGVFFVGGQALLLAWIVSAWTVGWSPVPAVRAAIGTGMVAVIAVLTLILPQNDRAKTELSNAEE